MTITDAYKKAITDLNTFVKHFVPICLTSVISFDCFTSFVGIVDLNIIVDSWRLIGYL